jgi:hypothetical protein
MPRQGGGHPWSPTGNPEAPTFFSWGIEVIPIEPDHHILWPIDPIEPGSGRDKDNVKGHIFAFLALYLVVALRKKIAALGRAVEWADLMRDLSQLRAIGLQLDDHRYLLRTDLRGTAHVALEAVGLRPPPLAQVLEAEV